jgi:hypothetical protein
MGDNMKLILQVVKEWTGLKWLKTGSNDMFYEQGAELKVSYKQKIS